MVTGALRVQLIAKREAGVSGTSRYTGGLRRGLQDAGMEVSITFPAPPPVPGPLLGVLKRLGLDLACPPSTGTRQRLVCRLSLA